MVADIIKQSLSNLICRFLSPERGSVDILIGQSAASQNVTWSRYHARDVNLKTYRVLPYMVADIIIESLSNLICRFLDEGNSNLLKDNDSKTVKRLHHLFIIFWMETIYVWPTLFLKVEKL